jgi:hypothetical protein
MKIKTPKYEIGGKRTRREFLFFPKWEDDIFRWLEMATWEESFEWCPYTHSYYWAFLRWID